MTFIPPNSFSSGLLADLSVNAARAEFLPTDADVVLATGARTNTAGGFNGGGTGNKSILGVWGIAGLPLGSLKSLSYTWKNIQGPGGPFFNPPGGPAVQTPYTNILVDFDPNGTGNIKILVTNDDSLNPAITNAIGTYVNPGGNNELTYAWDDTMDVLIVGQVPPGPGGTAPNVSVGAAWPENSYSMSDLVANNPDAVLLDVFTGDGGLPAGTVTPALMLISGDSGNITRSGKQISSFEFNGQELFQ